MPPDVSVVVPVFNPGEFIEPCIDSLLAQTLGPQRCQLVFVDDGSSDETPPRLDRLAAEHPHVVVSHQPNSGWPGRPRNIGIDTSDGEFVFFCDHDDWLAPDGLEVLVATARRTDADIVIGKMVGRGRAIPVELFRQSKDQASVYDTNLMSGLTPHKLFRRSMLDEHGLRFPEGKRRLEDHTFVTAAYFAARNVAIVADRPIYHHVRRDDVGNAAYRGFQPVGYYRNAREAMDIVAAHVEPGEMRDALMWRFLRGQMLNRLSEPEVFTTDEPLLQATFDEVRTLLLERYPPTAIHRLRTLPRARSRAIAAGRLDLVRQIAEQAREITATGRVTGVVLGDGGWRLDVDAAMADRNGMPVRIERVAEGWRLCDVVPPGVDDQPSSEDELLAGFRARVTLRERDSWVEWIVPATVTARFEALPDGAQQLRVDVIATIDPRHSAGGHALPVGRWDLWLGLTGFGLIRKVRIGQLREASVTPGVPLLYGDPPMLARSYLTEGGDNLTIDVGPAARRLPGVMATAGVGDFLLDGDRLRHRLAVRMAPDAASPSCRMELRSADTSAVKAGRVTLSRSSDEAAELGAPLPSGSRPGRYEVWLGTGAKAATYRHVGNVVIGRQGLLARWPRRRQ